jgi:hypothetical protein
VGTSKSLNKTSAIFRKVVKQAINKTAKSVTLDLSASSMKSRKDMRLDLVDKDGMIVRAKGGDTSAGAMVIGENLGGSDCGRIEIYDAEDALTKRGDYDIFNEEKKLTPLCLSPCISAGAARIECNITEGAFKVGRRLSSGSSNLAISFTGVGSGYDQMNFAAKLTISNAPAKLPVTPVVSTVLVQTPSVSTTRSVVNWAATFLVSPAILVVSCVFNMFE